MSDMETDAVPDESSSSNLKKERNESKEMPSNFKKGNPSGQPIHQGNVYHFVDSKNIHIGHVMHFRPNTGQKKNGSKKPKKEPPPYVTDVITNCFDLVTIDDVKIIKNLIKSTWKELAENIKTHACSLKGQDLGLMPHTEVVHEVLCSWIEEHSDSALVAILVYSLWNSREMEAAKKLAKAHSQIC